MSYRFYATKKNPLALWMMDDSSPYQEYSGRGLIAATKSGTAANAVASSVVSSAIFSSVFTKTAQSEYDSPVFIQGRETDPFALEAWLYPINRTDGNVQQAYRENQLPNPSAEGTSSDFLANNSYWTRAFDTTTFVTGTRSVKFTVNNVAAGAHSMSMYGVGHVWSSPLTNPSGWRYVTPNETYTFSVYLRPGQAAYSGYCSINFIRADGTISTTSTGTVVPIAANTWGQVFVTGVAPADAAFAGCQAMVRTTNSTNAAIGDFANVDAAMFVKGTDKTYFDGSMTGYEWTGAANNSSSRTMSRVSRMNLIENPQPTTTTGWGGVTGTIVTAPWDSTRSGYQSTGNGSSTPYVFSDGSSMPLFAGQTITISANVYMPVGIRYYFRVHRRSPNTYYGGQTFTSTATTTAGTVRLTHTFTLTEDIAAGNLDAAFVFADSNGSAAGLTGVSVIMGDVLMEVSGTAGSYFDGGTLGSEWAGTANLSASYLLVSNGEQQVLSNNGQYDGLTVNGNTLSFKTKYLTAGEAKVSYDIQTRKAVHAVGIHNGNKNELYVNGELVGSVELTDDQKNDKYITTNGHLYSGNTESSQAVAINGVALYQYLSPEDIKDNFAAGRRFLSQTNLVPAWGGDTIDLTGQNEYMSMTWAEKSDFQASLVNNVVISDTQVTPYFVNGVSLPGSWTVGAPIDTQGITSIYGVSVDWSGNNITVDASLDGTTWVPVTRGRLVSIIPENFDPTNKDLQVRVSFAGGQTDDSEFLDSLTVSGYSTNNIATSASRPIVATYPSLVRGNYEPIEYNDRNGIVLSGGKLVISADEAIDAPAVRTVEIWIKPISGTPTINVNGTRYRNGALDSTLPVGEWSLVHITTSANINNVHPDPGFELGKNNYNTPTNGTTALDTTIFHSGVQSLKQTTTTSAANTVTNGNLLKTDGLDRVYASAWVYNPLGNTGNVSIRIGGASVTASNSPVVTTKGEWVHITHSVPVTGTGLAQMVLYGPQVAGESAYWDDLTFSQNIEIAGDAIVGQVSMYPTVLTTAQMDAIYRSYTGYQTFRVTDAAGIQIVEPATPVKYYSYDWSITGAGG